MRSLERYYHDVRSSVRPIVIVIILQRESKFMVG